MRRLASRATLAAGAALVLLTNAMILGAAAWNRAGEPEAVLQLTERELSLPTERDREDTSLFLSIVPATRPPRTLQLAAWRMHRELPALPLAWLDRDKLRELGFDVALDPSDPRAPGRYEGPDVRAVFLALEYDGEAWASWIATREEEVARLRGQADAETLLAFDRTMRSRLVPIDASSDPRALRRAHPDTRRVAIVSGLVRRVLRQPAPGAPTLGGDVIDLVVSEVRVPREIGSQLEPLVSAPSTAQEGAVPHWPASVPPRFRAQLAFGRRLEPWLVEVVVDR